MREVVSVCIATFRRPERLDALLGDLAAQSLLPQQVVVVDNDAQASARGVIERRRAAGVPWELRYDIQPERNIARTRNLSVSLATGDCLAFVDDDERAPPMWLQQLRDCAAAHQAQAVLGPVVPQVPDSAPAWIRRGSFYDFPRMRTGETVPLNRLRFGNVLIDGAAMRAIPGPFDERYGLTTGEDADMLIKLVNRGGKAVWCDEAIVHEPVEAARLSQRWLLQRAVSGGQEFARKALGGKYGPVGPAARLAFLGQHAGQTAAGRGARTAGAAVRPAPCHEVAGRGRRESRQALRADRLALQ